MAKTRTAPDNALVLYKTHPGPQTDFMLSDAEELLYGGAAGGGKSYALRAYGVTYCLTHPGAKVVLFRQTFPQLNQTHLLEIANEVPQSVAHYAAAQHDLRFPNGSIFMFRHCEKDEDARLYDSAEFDVLMLDELTAFSQFQYTYLISRVRSTRSDWEGPRIRAGATPLGPGHSWVKNRFMDGPNLLDPPEPFEIWQGPVSEGGLTRQFIPAKVSDNPSIDLNYIARLRAMTTEEYRAKALGDWNVFTGQFFTRWRDDVHVMTPFDIPPDWERFLCVDYGYNAPYASLWFARPPGTNTAYVYREQYGKGITLEEQIYRAAAAVEDSSERIRAVILDPSMFGKVNVKGERIDSMADDWKKVFSLVVKGNNERVPGWRLLRETLEWTESPEGGTLVLPRLHVFSNCSNLIRTLPLLIMDRNLPEDVDSSGEDHAADALRYGLMYAFSGGGSPKNALPRVHVKRGRLMVSR